MWQFSQIEVSTCVSPGVEPHTDVSTALGLGEVVPASMALLGIALAGAFCSGITLTTKALCLHRVPAALGNSIL